MTVTAQGFDYGSASAQPLLHNYGIIEPIMTVIAFGLLSALSWGAGDFSGGLVSRRAGAIRTVFLAETFGLVILLGGLIFFPEPTMSWLDWIRCGVAGAAGGIGLVFLYRAMTSGQISVAAPVSAVTAAGLTVLAGSPLEGLPGGKAILGFGLALGGIWLVSYADGKRPAGRLSLSDLRLPLLAGACFACYFILMNQGSQAALVWPVVAARAAGALTLGIVLILSRQSWSPQRAAWPFIALSGVLDVGGNIFYILAGQTGRLDTAAVLGSLYPGMTVLLAWIFLHERLIRRQWVGVLLILGAVVLLSFQA